LIWSKLQKQKLYWERGARRRTYETITSEIKIMLENPDNCKATFNNITLTKISNDTIAKIIETMDGHADQRTEHYPISSLDSKLFYGHSLIKINKYKIIKETLAEKTQQFGLEIEFNLGRFKQVDKHYKTRVIPIYALIDTNNLIAYCSSGISNVPIADLKTNFTVLDINIEKSTSKLTGNEACEKKGFECAWMRNYKKTSLSKLKCKISEEINHIKSCDNKLGNIDSAGCQSVNSAFCVGN
jgi:transcriptional regulator of heat shock response